MIVYFTFVCQFSADKIIKAFNAKANLASLLTTGHSKEQLINRHIGKRPL